MTYFVEGGGSVVEQPGDDHQYQRDTDDQPQTVTCHSEVVDVVDLEPLHRRSHLSLYPTRLDATICNEMQVQITVKNKTIVESRLRRGAQLKVSILAGLYR